MRRAIELVRQIRESRLDRGELRRRLEPRLLRAVRYAWDNVPFYRDKMSAAGVHPSDIRTPEDLEAIPVTHKEELREAGPERTLARGHTIETCRLLSTSGSTGEPFSVYLSPRDVWVRDASQVRPLLAAGFRPRDRMVVVGPSKWIPAGPVQRLGFFRRVNLDPGLAVEQLAARLRAIEPDLLWIYPEHLAVLLAHTGNDVAAFGAPRAVITSAAMGRGIFDGVPDPPEHFDFYGSAEAGRMAWECQAHQGLHLNVLQVHVELAGGAQPASVVDAGTAPPDRGTGEVIVTTLFAEAMPFLRYHLGDVTEALPGHCRCGLTLPMISAPEGRLIPPLRMPSGKLESPHPLSFTFRDQPWIRRFHVSQSPSGELHAEIVPLREPDPVELERLRAEVLRVLHEPLPLELRLVAEISSGKGPRSQPPRS